MNKLTSYGITARALKLILNADVLPTEIPEGLFNWSYVYKTSSGGNMLIKRLHFLNVDEGDDQVISWNRNAKDVGCGCVLIYSLEDLNHHKDYIVGLSDDIVLQSVNPEYTQSKRRRYASIFTSLCEPEHFFKNNWNLLLMRGGLYMNELNLAEVSMVQWWAYGAGLVTWIKNTANGKPGSEFRITCTDFSSWNFMKTKDVRYLEIKLNINRFWCSSEDGSWGLGLDNPCTPNEIPAMSLDGFVEYYPMRQIPCCGIAIDTKGKLHTIGALPTEVDGSWAFDDGSIREVFEQKAQKFLASK
jgi:hypothetical protein